MEPFNRFALTGTSFKSMKKVAKSECVFMDDSSSVYVLSKGKVSLKLNLGKILSLRNVLHALDIYRNLVFYDLLKGVRVRVTFGSAKFVVTKDGGFV